MAGGPCGLRSQAAITEIELGKPLARLVVPSMGSTATSKRGEFGFQVPSLSPKNRPGASSFAPSPITTSPQILTKSKTPLIASQAAASARSLSPRPSHGSTLRAAFSVARTNSNSIVRSRSGEMEGSFILSSFSNVICRTILSYQSMRGRNPINPVVDHPEGYWNVRLAFQPLCSLDHRKLHPIVCITPVSDLSLG